MESHALLVQTGAGRDVPAERFRYEPLPLTRFPLGTGPFRVRGLAYTTALEYVDKRLGGRVAIAAALGDHRGFAPYFDQLFLVAGNYDVSPLLALFLAAARIENKHVGAVVEARSSRSASADVQGLWRAVLKTSSPEAMARRLDFAFNRYFEPSRATVVKVEPTRFEGELSGVPAEMSGLFVSSTIGFVASALTLAGATDVAVSFDPPVADGELSGVPLVRTRFVATWK